MKLIATFLTAALAHLLAASPAFAAELAPRLDDRQVGISLTGISFPDTFSRDLRSGLENRVLIQLTVLAAGVQDRRDITIAVKYDLWAETFKVRMVAGAKTDEAIFKQVTEVVAHLSNLKITRLFPLESLPDGQTIALRADVLINPIEREKIERLRQWVAENSAPGGTIAANSAAAPLTSKPNDLFNKIFDQYISGADIVAPWRLTVTSKPFSRQQLIPES